MSSRGEEYPELRQGGECASSWNERFGEPLAPVNGHACGAEFVDASDLDRLTDAVVSLLPLDWPRLPAPFFPAHLPIALVDAVFAVPPTCDAPPPQVFTERYCRRFGLERTRADPLEPPPPETQETVSDLIAHYETLGTDAVEEILGSRAPFPGTALTRAAYLLRAARVLRRIGIEVLQDLAACSPRTVREALHALPGAGAALAHLILMYTGDDDFMLGDGCVRAFVARATNRRSVSPERAGALVRFCAHERLLSPRYLYWRIWSEDESAPSRPADPHHPPDGL